MRTFILRARKASVRADTVRAQVGSDAHVEIIAHTLANAFYYSQGMRDDVDVYVTLDSTPDFPRTVHFSASEGLSMPGFHEAGIVQVLSKALEAGSKVEKDGVLNVAPGIEVLGYGFDALVRKLIENRPVYLLEPDGADLRETKISDDPVFILSDHLEMPKNSIKGMERRGAQRISVGERMLFASQCVVLIHNELDRSPQKNG